MRQRLKLEFIECKKKRMSSYQKRKHSLKKKAYELATLCNVQVLAICLGPEGRVDVWPEDRAVAGDIIGRYLSFDNKSKTSKNESGLARMMNEFSDTSQLGGMSEVSLRELLVFLDSRLLLIKDMIENHNTAKQSLLQFNAESKCLQIVTPEQFADEQGVGFGHQLIQFDPYLAANAYSSQYYQIPPELATSDDLMQFAMNPAAYQMISYPALYSSSSSSMQQSVDATSITPYSHLSNNSTEPGDGANEDPYAAIGFGQDCSFYPLPHQLQVGIIDVKPAAASMGIPQAYLHENAAWGDEEHASYASLHDLMICDLD